MTTTVIEVVDGQIFKVAPPWEFKGRYGDTILAVGYRVPFRGPDAEAARTKMTKLVLNQDVEIRNPTQVLNQRLLCDVYFKGKNLRGFMVEYQ